MKRLLLFVGVLLLIVAFGAVVLLNPGEVEFHPTHLHSFRPMLGLLLIFTFCAGAAVAVVGGSLRNLSSTLGNWRTAAQPAPRRAGRRVASRRRAARVGRRHRAQPGAVEAGVEASAGQRGHGARAGLFLHGHR
jgi:hypothetical protein